MNSKPTVLIFDINETLLDLTPLQEKVNLIFKNKNAFDIWFQMLLHYSLVETVTGRFKGFSSIGKATFTMLMEKMEILLSESQIDDILGTIRKLPPYKDVIPALRKLKESGFTLVALTNGTTVVLNAQLQSADIDQFFDAKISVEEIQKYKPHRDTYQYVLNKLNVPPEQAIMIAAHAWDIMGAQRAGLQTAFIERPGRVIYPLAKTPTYKKRTVLELAVIL